MRIGVLGTGRMGAFRAGWLERDADLEVLVGSGDPARGRPVEEVLDAGVDAVVISSATPDHPGQIAACADRGLPMLCEKPRDLLIHDFDVARWLTGREAVEVYATGAVRRWERFARHGDWSVSLLHSTRRCGCGSTPSEERARTHALAARRCSPSRSPRPAIAPVPSVESYE